MTRKRDQSLPDVTTGKAKNQFFVLQVEKQAKKNGIALHPCLRDYKAHFDGTKYEPIALLNNLTGWLDGALEETKEGIIARFRSQWQDDEEQIQKSVGNSLRRSAGTNYQKLVAYALARYLSEVDSAWYLMHPVPKEFKQQVAITFTGGVSVKTEDQEVQENTELPTKTTQELKKVIEVIEESGEDQGNSEETENNVDVQPDVDLMLRNAAWSEERKGAEPILFLSIKTSLVDRAGQAARWKIYFDLIMRPCPHVNKTGCIYEQLGISMANGNKYDLKHGIVTANIYKMHSRDKRDHKGELNSAQTRSNLYMFDLKFTTRDDSKAVTPSDWSQFPKIVELLGRLSQQYILPK